MEELLKIAYKNFMDTEDVTNSKSVRIINEQWNKTEEAMKKFKDILSEKLFTEINDIVYYGSADLQEAAFIAGFSYCAKFLTNGKTDLLPND